MATARGVVSADTPLFLEYQKQPGYGEEPPAVAPPLKKRTSHFIHYRGLTLHLPALVCCILGPPLVFTYASTLLSFRLHALFPKLVWPAAALALLPAVLAAQTVRSALRAGVSARWQLLALALLVVGALAGMVFGEVVFWCLCQPFYFLEALKTYSNIDPGTVSGVRLMDAGKVHFSAGTRLARDMGMSFTTDWDIYCVAPVSTARGLPSQGATLAHYDVWAVGVNCCRSAEPSFWCGEPMGRAGLRQVEEAQRPFFRLAVQQAEVAYNIQAPHPVFFHWVKDPVAHESRLFEQGVESWVLANGVHFVINGCLVFSFVLLGHKPPKDDWLPQL